MRNHCYATDFMPADYIDEDFTNTLPYSVGDASFQSEDEAWEFAANWGWLEQPGFIEPHFGDDHTPTPELAA